VLVVIVIMPFATSILVYRDNTLITWDDLSNEEFDNIRNELNTTCRLSERYSVREDGSISLTTGQIIEYLNKPIFINSVPNITVEIVGANIAKLRYKEAGLKPTRFYGGYHSRYVHTKSADELTPELIERIGGVPPAEPEVSTDGYVLCRTNIPVSFCKFYASKLFELITNKGNKFEYISQGSLIKFIRIGKRPTPLDILKGKVIIDDKYGHYVYFA
jgi:hypothetical protein